MESYSTTSQSLGEAIIYLMDAVAKIAAQIPTGETNPVLRIYPDIAKRLENAPRFLFDNTAIHAAVELTLGRPKVLYEALEHCAVPYPRMWVEWEEKGREKLQQTISKFIPSLTVPGRPLPQRLGFLIEADKSGRCGEITWVWTSPEAGGVKNELEIPNVSAVCAYFNLDSRISQEHDGFIHALTLRHLWEDNPIQLKALYDIWTTARHLPSEWGTAYLHAASANEDDMYRRMGECYQDVYGEYVTVWAIMMLLTASKQAVDLKPVDRSKINKARRKRRDVPLLDHTEVTMHVTHQLNEAEAKRAPLGYTRKSPRVHLVSRYLARRGDKFWIVQPYLRGTGDRVERHVHVR